MITKNDYYMFEVDPAINRLFITMKGFWENAGVVPNYLTDVDPALDKLSHGFTNLVDVTQLKNPPKDVRDLFESIQKKFISRGMSKNAEVVSSAFVEVNLDEVASHSGMSAVLRQFKSMAEALAWLDEK